jgi:hypoxanthine-guanine phosphoribosyltransferase
LYETKKFENVYWFGYKFKDSVDSKTRAEFIRFLRGLSERKFYAEDKRIFVEKPLAELSKKASIRDIDCIIYPHSKRSDLNTFQCKTVSKYFNGEPISIELIKSEVKRVGFDYKKYFKDNSNKFVNEAFKKVAVKSIDDMMERIHKSDYFSIAELKTKYRHYIKNYLEFKDDTINLNNYKKALIIDDIATTGATLDHIISICKTLNPDIGLYIYSIIGKTIDN